MTATAPNLTRSGQLNRWWYVATGFLTLLFGTNSINALFNVLGPPMIAELGWTRGVMSNGLSLTTTVTGFSVILLGFLIDRFGPSKPSLPMSLLFGGGIMLLAAIPANETLFYLLCAVIGVGAAAMNPVAHATVVTAWFRDHRGLALGITMAGIGACGVVMPYLANAVLGLGTWRSTFFVLGLVMTIIPLVVYGFVTRMPAEHEATRKAAQATGKMAGQPLLKIALSSRQFWLLGVSAAVLCAATFGLMSQTVGLVTDQGLSKETALAVLSVISLASLAARLFVGYLLDRFQAVFAAVVIFALCGLGAFLMLTVSSPGLFFLAAVLLGLGLGAEGDILAYMTSRYFPQYSYGRVLGFLYFLYAQGAALGVLALGQIYNATKSYSASTVPIVGGLVLGIVCLLFLGPYKYTLDHRRTDADGAVTSGSTTTDDGQVR